MKKLVISVVAMLLVVTPAVFAGTQGTNTNTVSPTLQISATVQSAIRLTLSTGTTAALHCAVTPGGTTDYAMNFGTVDALAINAPSCGNVFAPAVPGTDSAIYWSDYKLSPIFTGQSTTNYNIKAQVTTNFTAADISVVRDTANSIAVPTAANQFTAMGVASQDTIATQADGGSGSSYNRFIGVAVAPTNGAGTLTGLQNATVTFTLTVQ